MMRAPDPRWLPGGRRTIGAGLVVLLVLVFAGAVWQLVKPKDLEVTAVFPRVVGLYPGDQVRILGVQVGTVEKLQQTGQGIEVTMAVDHGVNVPKDATAVVVAPNLVAGRFVQFSPVYRGGAKMASGTRIPPSRTEVPVEFDELKGALNQLATDLGPDRKDGTGPLGRALEVSADNFRGQGQNLNEMITKLSAAATTLSDNRGDIFLTVRNLAEFTEMLARNDAQMRSFTQQMTQLSGELDSSRSDLAAALKQVNTTLPQAEKYVRDNRPILRQNVKDLKTVSDTLAKRNQSLADVLQVAPTAISNVYNLYDPTYGAQAGAFVVPFNGYSAPGQASPSTVLCAMFTATGQKEQCTNLAGPLKALDVASRNPDAKPPSLQSLLGVK